VYRTGSQEGVFERVKDRIAQANERCDQWIAEQVARNTTLAPSPEPKGDHVGAIGDKVRLTLTVVARKAWKDRFLFTMKDEAGHTFTYWTNKDVLQPNETYDIGAEIRAHNVFAGVKQTELTACAGKRVVQ
jgi:hypothetical protein